MVRAVKRLGNVERLAVVLFCFLIVPPLLLHGAEVDEILGDERVRFPVGFARQREDEPIQRIGDRKVPTGAIYLGDLDMWSFTATQGQVITLSISEAAPVSAGFSPWIRPGSPTGAPVGKSFGAAAAQIARTEAPTATYNVIVGANDRF